MPLFDLMYAGGPNRFWIFFLVSVIMGGSTAYVSGHAIADTWRPFWQVIIYALMIGLAVRFIHFALFQEVLLSAGNYLIDCVVLMLASIVGYVSTRKRQMKRQYDPVLNNPAAASAKVAG